MRYLALLRGINVGQSGRIRMDALKQLMEQAGFSRVETYIQSGNVLFNSDLTEAAAQSAIVRALKENAGIATTAVLRAAGEMHAIVSECPFSAEQIAQTQAANPEFECLYVCLLQREPDTQAFEKLAKIESRGDLFAVSGRSIYLLLNQSIRLSKLAIQLQKCFPI